MKVIDAADQARFVAAAAEVVRQRAAARPDLAMTMPTGRTPIPLYRHLVALGERGAFSLDHATIFMLDEYLDLPTFPDGSFVAFLREHLGPLVFNGRTTVHELAPREDAQDLRAYDALLDGVGGLDLAIVGVGRNGHVGFNEPGSRDDERTHVVELSADTLEANFARCAPRATRAITVGLADLRRAKSVLVLVSGPGKEQVVTQLVDRRRLEEVPVTHLVDHPDVTVVVDRSSLGSRTDEISRGRATQSKGELTRDEGHREAVEWCPPH